MKNRTKSLIRIFLVALLFAVIGLFVIQNVKAAKLTLVEGVDLKNKDLNKDDIPKDTDVVLVLDYDEKTHKVSEFTVAGEDKIAEIKEKTYTFKMPDTDVKITFKTEALSAEVNKDALNEAITNATALKDKAVEVEKLPEAKDLEKDKVNAKKEDLDKLVAAIQEAQKVVDNKDATKKQVEEATTKLNAAVEDFNKVAVVGTKEAKAEPKDIKATLKAKVEEAKNLVKDVEVVEKKPEAKDLEKDKVQVLKADKETFEAAIKAAEEVVAKEDATKEQVEEATTKLNAAVEAFNKAKVIGTKEAKQGLSGTSIAAIVILVIAILVPAIMAIIKKVRVSKQEKEALADDDVDEDNDEQEEQEDEEETEEDK